MKRPKKAPAPTAIRWPGDVRKILERRMEKFGLNRTQVVCELIRFADSLDKGAKRAR